MSLYRLRALLAARFASSADAGLPWAAVTMQVLVAGVLCGLVGDALAPYAYAFFALGVAGLLVAVPLFGESGALLYADEARAWLSALPVRPLEVQIARRLHALAVLAVLSLGAALPAVVFAPAGFGAAARALLALAIVLQTLALAGVLLALLSVAGGRANGLLVLLQTAIFVALAAGGVLGLRHVFALAEVETFAALPGAARMLPPAWFAAPFQSAAAGPPLASAPAYLALAATLAALVLLAAAPGPRVLAAERGPRALAAALAPLRRLALAGWVRPSERASFELVWDALPRESEFALRTYPLLGIPLAFLLAGAEDGAGPGRAALFALLLFTPAAYLPILLTQVPASRSHRARWLLDLAPAAPSALHHGALKAVVLRFVVPLWLVLALFAAARGGAELALRWAPIGLLLGVLIVRRSWRGTVVDLPLSRSPDDVGADNDVFSNMLAAALALTLAAVAAVKLVTTLPRALAVCALLVLVECAAERAWSRRAAREAAQPSAASNSAP